MGFIYEIRPSDSPLVESVTRGRTEGAGSEIRPSEIHWHMVFTKYQGRMHPIFVGPLTSAGVVSYVEGAEILWVKFSLGTFMPHMPAGDFLDREILLPDASSRSFWMNGSALEFPDFENVETFVERLVRDGTLVRDPVVTAVLRRQPTDLAPRTLRHRFLQATGLTRSRIYQIERAQKAAALLEQDVPILDAVYQLGYYDQPHLTRSLKQWLGQTPAQIQRLKQPASLSAGYAS